MASKRVLLVGLGNYTHPQTRHSIGLLLLDYIASQLNLGWSKNKSIQAYVTQSTTIYFDPSQSSSKQTQTVQSKKEKKIKKKNWDFGSESDEDVERNIINNGTTVQDENDLNKPSSPENMPSTPILPLNTSKPKRFKPKPDPVPLELTLLKPLLLMNVSGKSVLKAVRELGFSHTNIIVIHDDMQREFGKISIKNGGSANGHNGVKSVIDHLKTDKFLRLRIGIGRPPDEINDKTHDFVTNFVLSRVPPDEMEIYNNDIFPRCKNELFKASIQTL
ncbi:hypothetical protein RclHR1_02570006 [Rhizophagus clarus]|uniref:peptidyl-tRNA hydrolase n=1 Tax=Rhizophagus clarus TaxID=94130 RepID=A0A2Z6R422_9GLOM|nr:hypothetical protein RclHR1_02570006 [Rhizophagus clarus]GES98796.1 probable peptidyl-tRNA hydrolase [Rhizophagus clarus]